MSHTEQTREALRFTKKPVTIDAIQWDGSLDGFHAIRAAFPSMETCALTTNAGSKTITHWRIRTLEDGHVVSPGDWIIRGVKGEFYPCKPDIFEATYCPALTAPAAEVPEQSTRLRGGVPEIDYDALIRAAFAKNRKWAQGTNGCVAFAKGAEWFREQALTAAPQAPAPAPVFAAWWATQGQSMQQHASESPAEFARRLTAHAWTEATRAAMSAAQAGKGGAS